MEIKLVGLCKYFVAKNKKVTKAVDNMDLTIPSGKLVALLGPSGCGKSTTLYMIAGLHTPTSGQIFFGDDDVTSVPPEKRGIGLVFQNYALYPHLTVRQNIAFPLENEKVSKDKIQEIVLEMAKLVAIEDYLDRKPSELSGGQQQRVAIARALAKKPRVLLLDEPLSNLDARLRLQTREEIRRIQKATGITTVFVTHDQEEAMSISDEIVVMREGVIQQIGIPQEVYDHPTNLFVAKFLGNPQINVFEGTLQENSVNIGGDFEDDEALLDDGTKTNSLVFKGGKLFHLCNMELDNNKISSEPQRIYVAIRPEGFVVKKIYDPETKGEKAQIKSATRGIEHNYDLSQTKEQSEKGIVKCIVDLVETIGRDTTLILHNPHKEGGFFKAIIPSDLKVQDGQIVELAVKYNKMFVFDNKGDLI